MKKDMITGMGCVMSSALSVATIENILSIIALIITILTALFTLGCKVYEKIQKAKEDGKITKDELDDIIDTASDGINEIKNDIESR